MDILVTELGHQVVPAMDTQVRPEVNYLDDPEQAEDPDLATIHHYHLET